MRKNSEITILVVDDEESLRKVMVQNLELEEFRVLSAVSGSAAMAIVEREKIDFVLSDVRMPDGDGVELLEGIKKFNDRIPIVLLVTGFTQYSKKEAQEMGAIDLLTKPVNIDAIIELIRKLVV